MFQILTALRGSRVWPVLGASLFVLGAGCDNQSHNAPRPTDSLSQAVTDPLLIAKPGTKAEEESALLNAINFALTGQGAIKYNFSDRAACAVYMTEGAGDYASMDIFYLNNIDASRIAITEIQGSTSVELHGESTIREHKWRPPPPANLLGFPPPSDEPQNSVPAAKETTKTETDTDTGLILDTSESERLSRAWRYIYSHGCNSAKSSF